MTRTQLNNGAVASGALARREVLAQELFEAITQFYLTTRTRRGDGELKEVEFLALSILQNHKPLIVGDISRQLNASKAQMSRIIRSLEDRDRPFVACQINRYDKRKINVALTEAGIDALQERIATIAEMIDLLSDTDVDDLGRLLKRFREVRA